MAHWVYSAKVGSLVKMVVNTWGRNMATAQMIPAYTMQQTSRRRKVSFTRSRLPAP